MPFPEQIEKLLSKLTELTAEGKVGWKEGPSLNSFLASVGDFTVAISRGGSELYGGYSFQIMDRKGRAVDGALATFVGPEKDAEGHENWRRMGSLYDLARGDALKSDKAVSNLLESLEQIR